MLDKTCPQCGSALLCAADQDHTCWCAIYPAVMPVEPTGACLCKVCLARVIGKHIDKMISTNTHQYMLDYAVQYRSEGDLIEQIDYTIEAGNYVFSAWYHLKRGTCCGNGCRNCPYSSA